MQFYHADEVMERISPADVMFYFEHLKDDVLIIYDDNRPYRLAKKEGTMDTYYELFDYHDNSYRNMYEQQARTYIATLCKLHK